MGKNKDKVYAFTNPAVRQMLKEEKRPLYIWIACLGLALIGTAVGWAVS